MGSSLSQVVSTVCGMNICSILCMISHICGKCSMGICSMWSSVKIFLGRLTSGFGICPDGSGIYEQPLWDDLGSLDSNIGSRLNSYL